MRQVPTSLIETGRVRVVETEAEQLLRLYGVKGGQWTEIMSLVRSAEEVTDADALAWITSHSFRKTTATPA